VRVRFRDILLDTDTRQLTRGRTAVHLSPKAFDLLVMLVERRPAVVPKAELRERLWPGVHVVDAGLTNLIAEIRAAVEEPGAPPLVRTVHRIGYAFSGDAVDADAGAVADSPASARCWVVWKDRAIVLNGGENVIGRDAASAVWIDDESVSRRHARIRVPGAGVGDRVSIEDLNSTNGTYLRGRRLTAAAALENGDRIRVGTVTLVFRTRNEVEAPTRRVRPRAES
jgi:DNA-binding winged helix-turn-helix (wHTH) protein